MTASYVYFCASILYTCTRLLLPHVKSTLLHLQRVSPRLEFAHTSCNKNIIILDTGIHPVINSPTDKEDERGKNKTWTNIFLFTVV